MHAEADRAGAQRPRDTHGARGAVVRAVGGERSSARLAEDIREVHAGLWVPCGIDLRFWKARRLRFHYFSLKAAAAAEVHRAA
jgi:hypothetical protein